GNGNQTKYEYDGADRLRFVHEGYNTADVGTTEYTYDAAGNVETMKDARQHTTTYGYDERYRLISETNAENETTTYGYDAADNRTSVTDPKTFTTTFGYGEINELLWVDETARGGGLTVFVYDGNRNMIAQQDADQHLVVYAYDKLNRLTDTY